MRENSDQKAEMVPMGLLGRVDEPVTSSAPFIRGKHTPPCNGRGLAVLTAIKIVSTLKTRLADGTWGTDSDRPTGWSSFAWGVIADDDIVWND
jgi:hypothetical protein